MAVDLLEGEESPSGTEADLPGTAPPARRRPRRGVRWWHPRASRRGVDVEFRDLVLLDSAGNHPVTVHALQVGGAGIGLVGRDGHSPRVLPWRSVVTHAVEPWPGGVIPHWWVDTTRRGGAARTGLDPVDHLHAPVEPHGEVSPDARSASRARSDRWPLPYVEAGALIDIRAPSGTFRFLLPRADPATVAEQIAAVAVRQRGLAGVSSVTRVVSAAGPSAGTGRRATGWQRVRPFLCALLLLVIATAVTLILLQSAGAVHLPFLGGTGAASTVGRHVLVGRS